MSSEKREKKNKIIVTGQNLYMYNLVIIQMLKRTLNDYYMIQHELSPYLSENLTMNPLSVYC